MTDDSLDILNKLDPNLNCNASSCVTKQKNLVVLKELQILLKIIVYL
jgi:hypothetical protein